MRQNRHFARLGLLVMMVGTVLSLAQCGVPLFSPDAVLAAGLISRLTYEGQGVAQIPDNSNNFDPANLRFVPSRVRPIESFGPDGLVVGEDSMGVGILAACPNPSDTNPATSGIRILPNANDGFGFSDSNPLHVNWVSDTVTASAADDDYYARIVLTSSPVFATVKGLLYPTQSSSLQSVQLLQLDLDSSIKGAIGKVGAVVGGSIRVDSSAGATDVDLLFADGSGLFYPVFYQVQPNGTMLFNLQIGSAWGPLALTDTPANGAYFYDPSSGREFFSYEWGGVVKTVTWVDYSAGNTEIPVHDIPTAVLPGGKLYVEKNGEARVYNADGSLLGRVNSGGLHFVHMRWYSAGVERMIFTYTFAANYNGQKGVYMRTYSTTVADFLSLLN